MDENTTEPVGRTNEPLTTLLSGDPGASSTEYSVATVNNSFMDVDFDMTEEEEAEFSRMAQEKIVKFNREEAQTDSGSMEDTNKTVSITIFCIHQISMVFKDSDIGPGPSSSNQAAGIIPEVKLNINCIISS